MAATGYTPIQLYYSSTGSAVPLNTNLANGELAINITDGKLFYKDNTSTVQVIGWLTTPATAGGTGQTTYTTGDLLYASATNTLSKLAAGTNGYVLTMSGGVPTWAANTGGVTSFQTSLSGLTPSSSTTGAITLAGTLGISSGGTGQTTANAAFNALAPSQTSNSGKYLTTDGSNTSWASITAGASLSNDTSTASNLYPMFAAATSGTPTTVYTSNAKLLYKPSTGEFQASELVASNGIFVNNATVGTSYTIASGYNGSSVGPMTISSGVSVTVASGQRWVVL